MARKGNPISVRLDLNCSSDSSRKSSGKFIRFLLLITVLMFVYIITTSVGGIPFFCYLMTKVAGFLGVKALSSILLKMGCSSTLAFVTGWAFRALVTTEATPYVNMVLPETASSPLPSLPSPGSTSSSWISDLFRGGAEASSSAPLPQQGAQTPTHPTGSPSLSGQLPILDMPSPQIREIEELFSDFPANEASSSAREMAGNQPNLQGARQNEPAQEVVEVQQMAPREWEPVYDSKEMRRVERHMEGCEKRIQAMVERAQLLYERRELELDIRDKEDIERGFQAYFADIYDFPSPASRRKHLERVLAAIGNARSPIWRSIKKLIES